MKAVIDRFEGTQAVLTPSGGGRPFSLPKGALPAEAAGGDTVELVRNSWVILKDETEERRKRIADKARRLFRE
jgi:hypothetical protein